MQLTVEVAELEQAPAQQEPEMLPNAFSIMMASQRHLQQGDNGLPFCKTVKDSRDHMYNDMSRLSETRKTQCLLAQKEAAIHIIILIHIINFLFYESFSCTSLYNFVHVLRNVFPGAEIQLDTCIAFTFPGT